MGQGVMGYTTNDDSLGMRSSRKSFTIDENELLNFNNASIFYACPANIHSFILWAPAGTSTPGFQKDCRKVALKVVTEDHPVVCKYTSNPRS
jgi:hypothetical protein